MSIIESPSLHEGVLKCTFQSKPSPARGLAAKTGPTSGQFKGPPFPQVPPLTPPKPSGRTSFETKGFLGETFRDDYDYDDYDYYYYYYYYYYDAVPPWCDAPSLLDRFCTWMLSF